MKRFFPYFLMLVLIISCSQSNDGPIDEIKEDSVEQEEPVAQEAVFENTDDIDWFFYHNPSESHELQIKSVMTDRDSTIMIETYSSNDVFTESMLIKQKESDQVGVFLANCAVTFQSDTFGYRFVLPFYIGSQEFPITSLDIFIHFEKYPIREIFVQEIPELDKPVDVVVFKKPTAPAIRTQTLAKINIGLTFLA